MAAKVELTFKHGAMCCGRGLSGERLGGTAQSDLSAPYGPPDKLSFAGRQGGATPWCIFGRAAKAEPHREWGRQGGAHFRAL